MKRFLLVFLGFGVVLLAYGVVRSAGSRDPAQAQDAALGQSPEQQKAALDEQYRQLIGPEGEYARTKDEVRRSLIEADKELRQVTGGNARRLIEKANRKPRLRPIGECAGAVREFQAEPTLVIPEPEVEEAPFTQANPDEPQTPLVRALLGVLDEQDPQKLPASPQEQP